MHHPPSTIHHPQGQTAGAPPQGFPDAELQARLPELRQIAVELFGEPVTVEIECDAEVDDDWYVVFQVVLPRDRESQSISLEKEWLRRTELLTDIRLHLIRLSISPEP